MRRLSAFSRAVLVAAPQAVVPTQKARPKTSVELFVIYDRTIEITLRHQRLMAMVPALALESVHFHALVLTFP